MSRKAGQKRSGVQRALDVARWTTFNVAWPAALTGVIVQQVVKRRRDRKAKQPPAGQQQQQQPKEDAQHSQKEKPKPRRDYKVALDPQAVEDAKRRAQEEAAAAVAAGAAGLQPDDQLEAYNEQEVDALQAAQPSGPPGEGGGGGNFISMLKSLGYRVVVPSDGSGQVLLVPPGEKLEGEEGADDPSSAQAQPHQGGPESQGTAGASASPTDVRASAADAGASPADARASAAADSGVQEAGVYEEGGAQVAGAYGEGGAQGLGNPWGQDLGQDALGRDAQFGDVSDEGSEGYTTDEMLSEGGGELLDDGDPYGYGDGYGEFGQQGEGFGGGEQDWGRYLDDDELDEGAEGWGGGFEDPEMDGMLDDMLGDLIMPEPPDMPAPDLYLDDGGDLQLGSEDEYEELSEAGDEDYDPQAAS